MRSSPVFAISVRTLISPCSRSISSQVNHFSLGTSFLMAFLERTSSGLMHPNKANPLLVIFVGTSRSYRLRASGRPWVATAIAANQEPLRSAFPGGLATYAEIAAAGGRQVFGFFKFQAWTQHARTIPQSKQLNKSYYVLYQTLTIICLRSPVSYISYRCQRRVIIGLEKILDYNIDCDPAIRLPWRAARSTGETPAKRLYRGSGP